MPRKNCLIKISGDMLSHEQARRLIKKLSRKHFVVVCVGGGSQINKAFKKAGLSVNKFGLLGRETETFKERKIARDVLEKNQTEIQDQLALLGVYVNVVIPVFDIGTVLCHINGDQFVLAAYQGFDIIYIITTKKRVAEKRKTLAAHKKIQVVGW